MVDVYLSVRLGAGTLHLANYLIRATFYCLDAKVTLFLSSAKLSCTPSGKTGCFKVSFFLFRQLLKIMQLWITGVWNPSFEFADPLQVLQEKVRQYVTWGYRKRPAMRRVFFVFFVEQQLLLLPTAAGGGAVGGEVQEKLHDGFVQISFGIVENLFILHIHAA